MEIRLEEDTLHHKQVYYATLNGWQICETTSNKKEVESFIDSLNSDLISKEAVKAEFDKIIDPIKYLKKQVSDGADFNGDLAVSLIENKGFYVEIAEKAIKKLKLDTLSTPKPEGKTE